MSEMPDEIWAFWSGAPEKSNLVEGYWRKHNRDSFATHYIRADIDAARIATLEAEIILIRDQLLESLRRDRSEDEKLMRTITELHTARDIDEAFYDVLAYLRLPPPPHSETT